MALTIGFLISPVETIISSFSALADLVTKFRGRNERSESEVRGLLRTLAGPLSEVDGRPPNLTAFRRLVEITCAERDAIIGLQYDFYKTGGVEVWKGLRKLIEMARAATKGSFEPQSLDLNTQATILSHLKYHEILYEYPSLGITEPPLIPTLRRNAEKWLSKHT